MKKVIVILAALLAPTLSLAEESCSDAFNKFVADGEKKGLAPQAEIPLNETTAMYVMANEVGPYAEIFVIGTSPLGNPTDPKAKLLRRGTCEGRPGQTGYYVVISVTDPGQVTQN
jgi:hypothetical protein